MSIEGTPKFTSLVVKEITAEINGMAVILTAKAAFVDTSSNATHGWTKGEGAIWSKETVAQLLVLQQMMEVDLAQLHFIGDGGHTLMAGRVNVPMGTGGIAEHLEEADQA